MNYCHIIVNYCVGNNWLQIIFIFMCHIELLVSTFGSTKCITKLKQQLKIIFYSNEIFNHITVECNFFTLITFDAILVMCSVKTAMMTELA